MKITLGFATRKRSSYMISSIMSWLTSALEKNRLEFIVALDEDDIDSIERYKELEPLVKHYGADIKLLIQPTSGYKKLFERHNQMVRHMTGDCIIMLADDFFCETLEWDFVIEETLENVYEKNNDASVLLWMCGINLEKSHPECVGLNKKWLEISKVFSPTNACDAYARDLALAADLTIVKPPIIFYHLQRKLERPNELNPNDGTEFFRKPKQFEGNEDRWIEFYGEQAKNAEWRQSIMHEDKYYRYEEGLIGEQFKLIVKEFKKYYGN
tara:strand:+ start:9085 stop:9891 length:807 start_codon:yes stop_codon:yes gene_type:complete